MLDSRIVQNGKYVLEFANKEMEEGFHRDIAYPTRVASNITTPEIQIISVSLLKAEIPDFHAFAAAINVAIMKFTMRPETRIRDVVP